MRAGEFLARERVGDGNNSHVRGARRFDPGGRVFNDAALFGRHLEEFGRAEEHIGSGFAFRNVLDTDNGLEIRAEVFEGEDDIDNRMVTAGSEAEFVNERKTLDEFRESFEDRLFATNHFQKAALLAFGEVFEGFVGFVFGDEVEPEGVVRAAVVLGKIDAVGLAVAHLFENFEEGAFVAGLGVDDDAVHVEDNGAEFLVHSARGIYGKSTSSPNIEVTSGVRLPVT